jgi:drug/metabolite transporter (DMT)-like permease
MSKQLKADILLFVITAVWGSSFSLMRNILEIIPSFAYLALRFVAATLVLVIIFYKNLILINRKALLYGSIIGLMLFLGMALQVTGLYFTTASNSAFITGLNVIMVPLVSSVFLRKKPDLSSTLGVFLAFGGLFFLSGGLSFHFNIGDLLTLLCAVCFTFQIIFIDRFTNDQDPVLLSIIQIGFAALLYLLVWPIMSPNHMVLDLKLAGSLPVIITLVITGVFGTALAYVGQNVVQRFTSPTRTALIFTAEPVFGAVFALIIPSSHGVTEALKFSTVLGCLLILGGMLISELKLGNKRLISNV